MKKENTSYFITEWVCLSLSNIHKMIIMLPLICIHPRYEKNCLLAVQLEKCISEICNVYKQVVPPVWVFRTLTANFNSRYISFVNRIKSRWLRIPFEELGLVKGCWKDQCRVWSPRIYAAFTQKFALCHIQCT